MMTSLKYARYYQRIEVKSDRSLSDDDERLYFLVEGLSVLVEDRVDMCGVGVGVRLD